MRYGILSDFKYFTSYIGEKMHWSYNPAYISISIMAQAQRRLMQMEASANQTYSEKTWGYEIWFANTEKYCGKKIVVRPKEWSSKGKFHYHEIKDETFFVVEGILILDIAEEDGSYERFTLCENDSMRVMPGAKHRFTAGSEIPCKFIEASTHHEEADSYRCYYDKEKGEWMYV